MDPTPQTMTGLSGHANTDVARGTTVVADPTPVVHHGSNPVADGNHVAPQMEGGPPGHVPTNADPNTGRKVGVGVTCVAVALAAVFTYGGIERHHQAAQLQEEVDVSAETPAAVQVMHVHRAVPSTVLALPGEARALNDTTLYARTSGYLKQWLVDIGDHVKQGQTLATIETPELDDQLVAAKAKVNQAESESNLAKAAANFAKVSFERFKSAAPQGVVSAQDRDQKKAEYDAAVAKQSAADAALNLAKAQVQGLQTLVSFKNVVAPFDGVITERHVDIGDLVTAGSTSSTTPLFSIARSDQIRVFVDVPQSASQSIKVGMPAVAYADDGASGKFTGKVDRTADALDPSTRTLRVEVLVPNPHYVLKPGMYVRVEFKTDRADPPLEVPASALTMRSTGPEVAVVAADGTVRFHPVNIVHDLGEKIEVSSGLAEGDAVALNISTEVADGDHVSAVNADDDGGKPAAPTAAPAPASAVTSNSKPASVRAAAATAVPAVITR
jgi:RND family efflux transporter MFP subunit